MRMLQTAVAAIAFAGLTVAHAQSPVNSEKFWQAPADQNTFTPGLTYGANKLKMKGADEEKVTGPTLDFAYERGINEMLSAGASIGYISTSNDDGTNESDNKGVSDLKAFLKGQKAFVEGSSFHFGATLSASLVDAEVDKNGDANGTTGGMALTPYVGYQWMAGTGVFGLKLSHDLYKGEREIDNKALNADVTEEGAEATTFAVFYEMPFTGGLVGFEAHYITTADVDTETKVGATTTKDTTDGLKYIGLGVYPRFEVNESTTIIGSISYDMLQNDEINNADVDSGNILQIGVAGRFTF